MESQEKKKIAPDVSSRVAALSRVIPDDAKDYFKGQCELMILEYGSNDLQFERMSK